MYKYWWSYHQIRSRPLCNCSNICWCISPCTNWSTYWRLCHLPLYGPISFDVRIYVAANFWIFGNLLALWSVLLHNFYLILMKTLLNFVPLGSSSYSLILWVLGLTWIFTYAGGSGLGMSEVGQLSGPSTGCNTCSYVFKYSTLVKHGAIKSSSFLDALYMQLMVWRHESPKSYQYLQVKSPFCKFTMYLLSSLSWTSNPSSPFHRTTTHLPYLSMFIMNFFNIFGQMVPFHFSALALFSWILTITFFLMVSFIEMTG